MEQELNQLEITNRIKRLIEEAMCSKSMYAKSVGIDPGNFIKKLSGTQKWTINDIKKICTAMNISKEWLTNGNGDVHANDDSKPTIISLPSDFADKNMDEPFADTKPRIQSNVVMAGHLSDYIEGVREIDCERTPIVQQFPTYDFTIIIKGNSMEPKFEGGDEIACRRVYDVIEWGKTYVLDTEDGAVIKRIYDAGDKVRCVSYNSEEYPDFFIDKKTIRKIFKIVGLLRI